MLKDEIQILIRQLKTKIKEENNRHLKELQGLYSWYKSEIARIKNNYKSKV